jgi:Flp pilus assembly pilin Flp
MNNGDPGTSFYAVQTPRSGRRRQRLGQTLVEYALILAIISVVTVGVIINLGRQVSGIYSGINSVVASAAASH